MTEKYGMRYIEHINNKKQHISETADSATIMIAVRKKCLDKHWFSLIEQK